MVNYSWVWAKPGETVVEVLSGTDVQIVRVT